MSGRYCVIGAGAAGLATARQFAARGLAFDVLEAADDIGGIWDAGRADSPMSRNTHVIASKALQAFTDFPMPAEYPDYPGHAQVLAYLHDFADAHELWPHIRLHSAVRRVRPAVDGPAAGWRVTLADGSDHNYAGVVIATGHDRLPRRVEFDGTASIPVLHANEYHHPAQLADRRVLVVGAGQSAADILSDCVVTAASTLHSSRRGFYCMPKYLFGRTTDSMLQTPMWRPLRRASYKAFFRFLRYRSAALGIPVPDFTDGLVIPMLGDQLHHAYTHGDITYKPGIRSIDDDRVTFTDGTEEKVDLVILATGYLPSYPFVDKAHLNWSPDQLRPGLYLNIFPPGTPNLFVVGMVRPIGSHWDIYEAQAGLVADYLRARAETSSHIARFDAKVREGRVELRAGLRLYNAGQYPLVVEKQEYRNQIRRHAKLLR